MTETTMQADKSSRAISFANGYFALVDGLAYGLEDHLTEDVRLEWFGRVVNGRKNVAAFMRNHMTNSRHIFAEITPAANIDSQRCRLPRRKYKSEGSTSETFGNITDSLIESELKFSSLRVEDEASNVKEEMNFELNDGDLKSLFSEETFTRGTEDSIKLEPMNEDRVQDVEPAINENDLIKFVQAKGVVQLDRRSARNKIRKWEPSGFSSGQNVHNWRRRCTLKVAYSMSYDRSIKFEENLQKSKMKDASEPMNCELNPKREISDALQGRKRLKSSDEILESIAGLGANFDPFEDFDCFDDRQKFLEFFEAEVSAGDTKFDLTTPKYVGDRLVFDWTGRINPERREYPKAFKFDYKIHTIVYECSMDCKLDLSQEFEKHESLEEAEKRV